jgi:hypothetical protein
MAMMSLPLLLFCTMGQSCIGNFAGLLEPRPGGDVIIEDDLITVELINTTNFPVEPFLYAEEDNDIELDSDVIRDSNFVDIGEPVFPGEVVQVDFLCEEIGAVVVDFPLLLISPNEAIESINGPLLIQELDYFCGDFVSFFFVDDPSFGFFTEVEVNGVLLVE